MKRGQIVRIDWDDPDRSQFGDGSYHGTARFVRWAEGCEVGDDDEEKHVVVKIDKADMGSFFPASAMTMESK